MNKGTLISFEIAVSDTLDRHRLVRGAPGSNTLTNRALLPPSAEKIANWGYEIHFTQDI